MKIGELRELIKDLPGELEVVMSSDPEGNAYRKLHDTGTCFVEDIDEYNIELMDDEVEEEEFPKAFVLWPA